MKIETNIIINSSLSIIWEILMDFENYPNWNPFIKEISKYDNKMLVKVQPVNSKVMVFKPKLIKQENNKEFRWKGKLLINGIFDGEHYFILEKINDNTTKFIQGENFTGILVPIFKKTLNNTKKGFILMNEALKLKAENKTE